MNLRKFRAVADIPAAWTKTHNIRIYLAPIANRYKAVDKYRIYALQLKTASQNRIEAEVPAALVGFELS